MMRRLYSIFSKVTVGLVVVTAWSCAGQGAFFGPGQFEIIQADTRFTESGNPTFTSRNNRISRKSIAGGIHIDGSGVFVNPTVTKTKDNQVAALGFIILNYTDYDTAFGAPNTLGIPQTISFLLNDTEPVILPIKGGDYSWSDTTLYNSVTQSASKKIIESGMASLTPEQYHKIISASSVAVHIQGSKHSVTYEANDISSTFIPNLASFYQQHVK